MVSSVWIGSVDGGWSSGPWQFFQLEWRNSNKFQKGGATVSAQATLSRFKLDEYSAPSPSVTVSALIKSYQLADSSPPVAVGKPILSNVENVSEIIFELAVAADPASTGLEATMVGTVFIQ